MAHTDRMTDRQTHGHGDSKTNSAKRAELVKNKYFWEKFLNLGPKHHCYADAIVQALKHKMSIVFRAYL